MHSGPPQDDDMTEKVGRTFPGNGSARTSRSPLGRGSERALIQYRGAQTVADCGV